MLHLRYRSDFSVDLEQIVALLGLAAKVNPWYLVCLHENHSRVVSTDNIYEARTLEAPALVQ
jgi:predicted DNA-binding transcriptional regulator YafY